jgi:HEAT repeat protein
MRAFAAALLSACISGCGRGDPPSSRPATLGDVKALAEQVRGGACSFGRSRESARCTHFALPALAWLNDRYLGSSPTRRYACVSDAAECLAEFGPAARDATTALIEALERGPNDYDTGDGVIPSRSYVAAALGKLEDPRAIEPLGRALRSGVPMDRGPGALESRDPAARGAVVLALARFGPKAIAYAPDFAAILRADERIASAAAEALGATESPEAAPALAAALTKPGAAEAAAKALGALGPSAAVSVPALARLLDSSATPSARTAPAEALGRLDDARAVPALAGALRDSLVREVAARSLGWLGPKAAGAVGPLIDVTRLNTGAVVNPNTGARSYDVQGTRVLAARIAATLALAKIGGARAQTVLYGLAGDPEVGHAARPRRDPAGAVR